MSAPASAIAAPRLSVVNPTASARAPNEPKPPRTMGRRGCAAAKVTSAGTAIQTKAASAFA